MTISPPQDTWNDSDEFDWPDPHGEGIKQSRIMIIDDEPYNVLVVRKLLLNEGYQNFITTSKPTQALGQLRQERPDVLLLDIMMPEVSGLDILQLMRADSRLRSLPVIVLTASCDSKTKAQALELGAADFLAKPVDPSELVPRLRNVLAAKAHRDYLQEHSALLERRVREQTQELEASRKEVIHCLARAAEFRDDDTGQHVIRVGLYAGIIARELGLDPEHVEQIELAAQLHDVGKIGISDSILLKPGKLEPDEFELMKKHCKIGKNIISPISQSEWERLRTHTEIGSKILQAPSSPILRLAAIIAQTHHERWDGSGYPLGLAGEDIPLEGRITAVADVFDALSSARPYKAPFPRERCFKILEDGRGTHFDPRVLDAFFRRTADIVRVQIECMDRE